ncbi:hypothetical protein EC836_1167 [Erwinia sp. JUb26]|nr:hypothetical protein EC836_1167 [Erwinia sp. JUb26]
MTFSPQSKRMLINSNSEITSHLRTCFFISVVKWLLIPDMPDFCESFFEHVLWLLCFFWAFVDPIV